MKEIQERGIFACAAPNVESRAVRCESQRIPTIPATVWAALGRAWWWLRQFSGDAAYDNYLRSVAHQGRGCLLSVEEFYLEQLHRRYAGISRCC